MASLDWFYYVLEVVFLQSVLNFQSQLRACFDVFLFLIKTGYVDE